MTGVLDICVWESRAVSIKRAISLSLPFWQTVRTGERTGERASKQTIAIDDDDDDLKGLCEFGEAMLKQRDRQT